MSGQSMPQVKPRQRGLPANIEMLSYDCATHNNILATLQFKLATAPSWRTHSRWLCVQSRWGAPGAGCS